MKDVKPKILVLGATGMVGRTVFEYLRTKKPRQVYGTSRKDDNKFHIIKYKASDSPSKLIKNGLFFEYIINCIGVLRGGSYDELRKINQEFPHVIEDFFKKYNTKIIHVSTDAVFPNDSGPATEDTKPNPQDFYGMTKLAGEISKGLNIRTSLIGFDPVEKKGLLEYVLKLDVIKGYSNQIWTGSTTLLLARFLYELIFNGKYDEITAKTNIIHFAPLGPVSKYDLLDSFSKIVGRCLVEKSFGININRVLGTKYIEELNLKSYTIKLEQSLKELLEYEQKKR